MLTTNEICVRVHQQLKEIRIKTGCIHVEPEYVVMHPDNLKSLIRELNVYFNPITNKLMGLKIMCDPDIETDFVKVLMSVKF